MCVDGIMAAKPRRLARVLRAAGPDDPCGSRVARRSLRASSASVRVPLRRTGQSAERRRGSVRLVRRGVVLGSGAYTLRSGTSATDATVRLTARGRAALRGPGRVAAQVQVLERGRVVRRDVVTLT
jgi:hypothetical protein